MSESGGGRGDPAAVRRFRPGPPPPDAPRRPKLGPRLAPAPPGSGVWSGL